MELLWWFSEFRVQRSRVRDMNLGYHLTLKTVSLLPGKLWQPREEVWEVWLVQRVRWCEEHDLLRKSSQSLDWRILHLREQ